VAVDCCITKAPCGGEKAGASPVDRGKQGLKRSTMVDGEGIPLGNLFSNSAVHVSSQNSVTVLRVSCSMAQG
jgi:hypothetical protein